jgi:hypothetical protein
LQEYREQHPLKEKDELLRLALMKFVVHSLRSEVEF